MNFGRRGRFRGGSSSQKVLPLPTMLSTPRVPSSAAMIPLESASPMPVPSISVHSAPSRSNGTNSRSIFPAGMPMPVSSTLTRQLFGGPRRACADDHVSLRPVVLHRVREQVQHHLLQALAIREDIRALGMRARIEDQLDVEALRRAGG